MKKFLDYAYPNADEPTLRIPAVEDEVESYIKSQLYAVLSKPCRRGTIPGTTKTYAEQKAEIARDLLDDLEAWRHIKFDGPNKIQPEKRKWGRG